jgi:hypothetical protein
MAALHLLRAIGGNDPDGKLRGHRHQMGDQGERVSACPMQILKGEEGLERSE